MPRMYKPDDPTKVGTAIEDLEGSVIVLDVVAYGGKRWQIRQGDEGRIRDWRKGQFIEVLHAPDEQMPYQFLLNNSIRNESAWAMPVPVKNL